MRHTGMKQVHRIQTQQLSGVCTLCVVLATAAATQMPAPVFASSETGLVQVPSNAKRAFARTAEKGHFTVDAVKESGEHGGGLCPTTEYPARFTREGNEAFGACMTLWNQHRWDEARNAMIKFSKDYPNDPWRGESDLHVACYHKFRGENSEAEAILAELYKQNKDNPIGRRALVRLVRVYFDTYRYQAAYETLLTLLAMDPTEHEKSYALSWLTHVSRSWMNAAASRECGPKAFGFAAWTLDNQERVRQHRTAENKRNEMIRKGREHGAYLPTVSFAQVAEDYPWAAQKGGTNGMSLSQMRDLLTKSGWTMETRRVSYEELRAYASEDRVAVLCLPAPSPAHFVADDKLAASINHKLSQEKMFAGGREAADLGHYMVLVKATPRNAWLLDPENGMLQKDALALKDLWLRGNDRGLAVFISRPPDAVRHEKAKHSKETEEATQLPGNVVEPAAEAAFFGGCCGHETINDDPCADDGPTSCTGYGMPIHQVNTINLNYQVVDTPIWIKTPGGVDLELTLTYNNRESYNAKYPITNVQYYAFGCRWSAPYDANYALDPASNILVRFPNGMETYFDRQTGGSYLPRDIRYLDHFDLTVLSNKEVRVDLKGGLARYYFHSLTNPALQQTLYRVENRLGKGVNVTRDSGGGGIIKVQSETTGASLNYVYNDNGNVVRVYEKDGAQTVTGREALFSYEQTNGVARLSSMTDMGNYTTTFEYGQQTYNVVTVDTNKDVHVEESVESNHHITAYTWPNGGRWEFDLHQTHYDSIHKYDQPLVLIITDPVGHETVYNTYSYSPTGPVGKKDRNGASRFWGLDDINNATLGKYSTLVNDRQGGTWSREGEYVDYSQFSASGKRELTFKRLMTEPVTGDEGLDDYYPITEIGNKPRKDTWYFYQTLANGHRLVTLSNAVYKAVTGQADAQLTDHWTEALEQDANEEIVRTVDRAGNSVYLDRNTNRLVTAVRIQPAGESVKTMWQAVYNDRGQTLTQTVDEALQAVVAYEYDALQRLSRIRHPDGTSESFGYDASTQYLSAYTNRTGQGVRFFRDAMGRPVRTVFADGTSTTNHYACCAADAVTDRHGVTARFGFDPNKRLETAVVPMNAAVETCVKYGYLGEGEVRSLGYGPSFTNLATRTFGFTVTNGATRLASRTTPRGKTTDAWSHTFTGLPATHNDGRGIVTSNAWDAAKGLLLQSNVRGSAIGLADVTVTSQYDLLDRLTNAVRTVSGSETWRERYAFDSRSRPVRTDTRVQNIPGQQNPPFNYSVTYAYDARGLITNRTLTVGSTVIPASYGYDPAFPRLASISDPYARAAYGYDTLGRLAQVAVSNVPTGMLVGRRGYGYDAFSRLSSLAVSNQTALLWGAAYTYDIDRLSSFIETTGGVSRATLYAYDLQGQLTGATGYSPTNSLSVVERFAYDAVVNLTARSLSAPPPPTGTEGAVGLTPNADDEAVLYKRHAVATLMGTVESNATLSLPLAPGVVVEKDARGNWIAPFVPLYAASNGQVRVQLKAEKAGQNPDYRLAEFTANRTSSALAYDANGALLNLPSGLSLAYDAEGNLGTVSSNGAAIVENWYDTAGRRIAKREGGVLTLYVWDGMAILATANADGTLKEYYTRGPGIAGDAGSLIAETRFSGGTASTVFLHNNHRGDVVLATDESGTAVGRYEYSAFGMPLTSSGAYTPRFGFSSKERDASGLVYYGFRFHSPDLCRWITPDPIGEDGGLNLYIFCGNAPENIVDLWGLKTVFVYDGNDEKLSKEFCNAANRYDWAYDMAGDTDLGRLTGFLKALSDLGENITMVVIADHGIGGHQEYNDKKIEETVSFSKYAREIGDIMNPDDGQVRFLGCNVGNDSDYLQFLANSFNRTAIAFDSLIFWSKNGSFTPGFFISENRWMFDPYARRKASPKPVRK